jgi:hypothetical protein
MMVVWKKSSIFADDNYSYKPKQPDLWKQHWYY